MDSLIAGGIAGTTVDILLFPLDSLKTRAQSQLGFIKSGAFKGVYNGMSSVVVGSGPSGAIFFLTYDSLKSAIPLQGIQLHILSASLAEIVSLPSQLIILS